MTTVVRFLAPAGQYALPVDRVTQVHASAGLTPLPEPQAGIAGLLRRGDEALTVLSILGEPGNHVIVVDEGGLSFGLLVTEVTGVQAVDDADIGPPPPGQEPSTVSGVIVGDQGVVLLLDPVALRSRLS